MYIFYKTWNNRLQKAKGVCRRRDIGSWNIQAS